MTVEVLPAVLPRSTQLRLVVLTLLAIAMFALAWVSLSYTRYDNHIASFWLTNAIVAAVLLRSAKDRWPELIAIAFAANVAAHLVIGDPVGFSLAIEATKIAEVLVVVVPLHRRYGTTINLNELRPLGYFLLLAGLVAPLVSAAAVALYFTVAEGGPIGSIAVTWFTSHALGFLIVMPLLLAIPANLDPFRAPFATHLERLAILAITGLVAVLVYSQPAPMQWAIMPLLVLAALRLPPCGVALAVAFIATIAVVASLAGMGPIAASHLNPTGQVLLLKAFVATAVLVTLPVSALINERNRLLSQVTIARDEAHAASEAKGNFLATMSHEIRTPMTGVLGMIELLRSDPRPEDRERYFMTLQQSANLLMTVLDDILDFSKLESGNISLEEVDFDVEELARATLNLFSSAASQKGLLLSMHCDCPPGQFLRGDATRIQQVISNLVNNAIKFTARGRITILVRSRAMTSGRSSVRVEVVDTGIGISDQHLDQLFQPFVQAESSTSRRFGGTGLGLAICRWLVAAMNGNIGVESALREGSTFWFEIPLERGLGPEWQAAPQQAATASRNLDILVAEDNPVNQLLIDAILRRLGHRATIVENGRVAVDFAERQAFDCVLMDMQMPEMDGMAATRAIRSSTGPNRDIPIIALTADVSSERRRFYDAAGLTDFLAKPIDRLALAARLSAIAGTNPAQKVDAIAANDLLAELPVLDTTNINQLCAAIGSTNFSGLLDLLQVEMAEKPAAIRLAVIEGDQIKARREAHSLKGACNSVGALALGQAAARIELAPDIRAMNVALPNLDRMTTLTRLAVEDLIPRDLPDRGAH